MSLHRYLVPPPLALAVHPAPAPKPRLSEKEKAEAEAKAKAKAKKQAEDENVDDKPKEDQGDKQENNKNPETPATPGSMIPEPPTPAPEADNNENTYKKVVEGEDEVENRDQRDPKGENDDKAEKGEAEKENKESVSIEDITPEPEQNEKEKEKEDEKPLEPIRLLKPVPNRPVRVRLDLNEEIKQYPPINTDPRGAYHKYAKAVGDQVIYVDITKDGWLVEQWKEKSERDALKRLNGDWEKELNKNIVKQKELTRIRDLPSSAQGILLELWNILVESDNYEIPVVEFWSKFDWTTESSKKHLLDIVRPIKDEKEKQDEEKKGDVVSIEKIEEEKQIVATDANAKKEENAHETEAESEIEWTKEGLEDILSTVGVQCVYNTDKPLKHWSLAAGAYLILAHGHFLLRTDMYINFKPEEKANNQFEVLITSGHDRVFGDMVKAQREKEYRERKEREKKEKMAAAAAKEKENNKEDKKPADINEAITAAKNEKKKQVSDDNKDKETPPLSPTSNVKLIDGEAIKPAEKDENDQNKDQNDDKAIIAIPVTDNNADNDDKGHKDGKDKKHEPGNAAAGAVVVPGPKIAEAKKPMNMDEIAQAFKAIENAQQKTTNADDKKVDKDKIKLIWQWGDRCEMWRWKNYEAGLNDIGPGGWEERDWKVFADDREVWDFDDDEAIVEVEEKDIHDWSL
ncbi:uncharacterized protein L201_004831 [Kwoniella dendrophila CBS 6074]|uniref:Uncharacterized protein n=1 Tax=Kwoniella dendrophila CBS 6074 TaxID=1295534 RepID=A0AAX4JX16_9TREE